MQINLLKITIIVLLSSLLGVLINAFSSRGIPLLYEKEEIAWGSDSLVNLIVKSQLPSDNKEPANPDPPVKPGRNEQESETIKKSETHTEPPVDMISVPVKINLETAYSLYNKNVLFVDARPPEEYHEGHIKGAYSIPYYNANVEDLLGKLNKDEPVVVYCSGTDCDLSEMLGNKMHKLGFRKVLVFFGGWNDWLDKNYPSELPE